MKQTATPTTTPAQQHGAPAFFGRSAQAGLSAEQAEATFFGPAPFIQAKLTIGAPDDPYEREADAVAEQVVQRMSAPASEMEEKEQIQPKIQRLPLTVQRKCAACEEEEKVQKKEEDKPEEMDGPIQRKPIFESNGDEEPPPGVQPAGPMVQRKCAACEQEEQGAVQRKPSGGGEMTASADVASRISHSKGGGSPLPESVQSAMGGALGADLSGVRVHTDSRAVKLNRDLGAQAFTHGSDVYFGAGKFQPGTGEGDRLLAHELVHVGQQGGGIRRSMLGDVLSSVVPGARYVSLGTVLTGAAFAVSPTLGMAVLIRKQFFSDLMASVRQSPDHIREIFVDELLEMIRQHWPRILAVTLSLIAAEMIIGALAAAPEPTMITKLIAIILQILVIAILGYSVIVGVIGAAQEGMNWFRIAQSANGNPNRIAEASRAFLRMILQIILAILALLGLRARVAGFRAPTGSVPMSGRGLVSGGSAGAEGGQVVPISSHPRYSPSFRLTATTESPLAFGPGGTARQLAPQPYSPPVIEPAPLPAPVPAPSAGASTVPAMGLTPVTGAAAGAAGALRGTEQERERRKVTLVLPPQKASHLALYQGLVLSRLLQHRIGRDRRTAQADRWDRNARIEMLAAVKCKGVALGLPRRFILRPDWSRIRPNQDFEVDHRIEMQVATINREAQFDQPWNYELLDRISNGPSGPIMRGNIVAERRRLSILFNDSSWLTRDLVFEKVRIGEGVASPERWLFEQVIDGAHLDAYQTLTGQSPDPDLEQNCINNPRW